MAPGKRLLEAEDVADLRTSPAVDALVVVADGADVPALASELPDQLELRAVGVLELVHQEVPEPADVAPQHVGVLAEEAQRQEEQVVEVHRALRASARAGIGETPGRGDLPVGRARLPVAPQRVLGTTPCIGRGRWRHDPPGIEVASSAVERRASPASPAPSGPGVGDGEAPGQAEAVVVAEHLGAEGVEGADGERLCGRRNQPPTRSLISAAALLVKVTARIAAAGTPMASRPGDAVGDHPGLAAAGAGEHEQRPFGGGDGLDAAAG